MPSGEHGRAVMSDGSVVEFEWCAPGGGSVPWWVNDEHHPRGRVPMYRWVDEAGEAGRRRAWDEVGIPIAPMFRDVQHVGPYHYVQAFVPGPEIDACLAATQHVMQAHGGFVGFWERHGEPRAMAACAELATMDDASLEEIAETFAYGIHQTMTTVIGAVWPVMAIAGLLDGAGLPGQVLAHQIATGGENRSQAIDDEIAALAQAARSERAVAEVLASQPSAVALDILRTLPRAASFLAAFDEVVSRHAARSEGWDLHMPTWGERPDLVLSLVAASLRGEVVAPAERAGRAARARGAALAEAMAALGPEQQEALRGLVAGTDGYVAVRESRAYWQMMLCGTLRSVLLRRGRALVDAGRVAQAEDILMLDAGDLREGPHDLRAVVEQHRAEWERFADLTPPRWVGVAPEEERPPVEGVLQGHPASRGTVRAVARVVRTPDDVDRLQPGEILVCTMTTPAWTPLFAIAGGVVTATGSPSSHPAITAREYGIPAVVGVARACDVIPDGAMLTVDGGAGTVRVEHP